MPPPDDVQVTAFFPALAHARAVWLLVLFSGVLRVLFSGVLLVLFSGVLLVLFSGMLLVLFSGMLLVLFSGFTCFVFWRATCFVFWRTCFVFWHTRPRCLFERAAINVRVCTCVACAPTSFFPLVIMCCPPHL